MPVILHPAKFATPLEALSGLVVQLNAPDEAASEMEALEEVTTLPPESSTLTTGWVARATPLVELPGVGGERPAGWLTRWTARRSGSRWRRAARCSWRSGCSPSRRCR